MNLYQESSKKVYYNPIRLYSLVKKDPLTSIDIDTGIDVTQTISFGFIREDLKECNYVIEIGDVIKFDERFYEVDNTNDTQYWGRNDETLLMNTEGRDNMPFGYSVSIVAAAHLTRLSQLNLVDIRTGVNSLKSSNLLPKNL